MILVTGAAVHPLRRDGTPLVAYLDLWYSGVIVAKGFRVMDDGGRYKLNMPSRPVMCQCPHCGRENTADSHYCRSCGGSITRPDLRRDTGRDGVGRYVRRHPTLFLRGALRDHSERVGAIVYRAAVDLANAGGGRAEWEGGWYEFRVEWPNGASAAPTIERLSPGSKL